MKKHSKVVVFTLVLSLTFAMFCGMASAGANVAKIGETEYATLIGSTAGFSNTFALTGIISDGVFSSNPPAESIVEGKEAHQREDGMWIILTSLSITAENKEVTYSDNGIAIPVDGMFSIPEDAGEAVYSVTNDTCEGTYNADTGKLTVTKCGTFTVKVSTAATDTHAAQKPLQR